jgi:hypothetical protein
MANFEENKEKHTEKAESKARRIWKEGRRLEKRSGETPVNELPWFKNIMKGLNYVKQGTLERQLEDAGDRAKVEEALGPIPNAKKIHPQKWGWEHWGTLGLALSDPLMHSTKIPSLTEGNGKPIPEQESNESASDTSNSAPSADPAPAAGGSGLVWDAAFSDSIRDKRSAGRATKFTQEQLEDIRRRNQPPASNRNANRNPVSNIDNNPIGDLNEVRSHDPTKAHRRRLGDTHDRPVAEEYDPHRPYNWNILEDLDMGMDLYAYTWNASDATVYPIEKTSVFMEKLITTAGSLPDLIRPVLWKMGIDPKKEMSAFIGQADQPMPVYAEPVTPMLLVLHFCTVEKLGYQVIGADQETIDFIDRITDLEIYEYENFVTKRALKPVEHGFRKGGEVAILEKLKEFGVDPEDKAILRRVTARRRGHVEIGTRGDNALVKGDLGTIIDVEKDGTIQRFAIIPHLPLGIIRIPHEHQQWKTWMRTLGGIELFFRDPAALPERAHLHIDRDEGDSSPIDTVQKAVKYTFKPIVKNTLAHMQSLIHDHSTGWEMMHMTLGLYIPYYDFVRATINNDYSGALWVLGFELVPKIGDTAKRLFTMKKIHIPDSITESIKKIPASDALKKVGKKIKNWGQNLYENGVDTAKSMNGLGFFVKRPKLRKVGGRAFARVNNGQNDEGEE